jgi:hypothetical protein
MNSAFRCDGFAFILESIKGYRLTDGRSQGKSSGTNAGIGFWFQVVV